jgi:hypothetical protein
MLMLGRAEKTSWILGFISIAVLKFSFGEDTDKLCI